MLPMASPLTPSAPKSMSRRKPIRAASPFLKRAYTPPDRVRSGTFPFTIPSLSEGIDLRFDNPVTFFVGENGSGKSTVLEAIAGHAGFNLSGGSKNHSYEDYRTESTLASAIRLSWMPRV